PIAQRVQSLLGIDHRADPSPAVKLECKSQLTKVNTYGFCSGVRASALRADHRRCGPPPNCGLLTRRGKSPSVYRNRVKPRCEKYSALQKLKLVVQLVSARATMRDVRAIVTERGAGCDGPLRRQVAA